MRIVVLFNLQAGASAADYERWVNDSDIPGVRGLPSVTDYRVHKTTGLLGSDAPAPFQYVEVIDIGDMAQFGVDAAGPVVQKLSGELASFADNPCFILTEDL